MTVQAGSAARPIARQDPCVNAPVLNFAKLVFTVCTSKLNYHLEETVGITLTWTLTGTEQVLVPYELSGFMAVDVLSHRETVFSSSQPAHAFLAPGESFSLTALWTAGRSPGRYLILGSTFACQVDTACILVITQTPPLPVVVSARPA